MHLFINGYLVQDGLDAVGGESASSLIQTYELGFRPLVCSPSLATHPTFAIIIFLLE